MKETNYNIIQGDSFLLDLTYSSSAGPIDLTGYSALMEIREGYGGKSLAASAGYFPASGSFSGLQDCVTISASSGTVHVALTPAKTRAFILPKSAYQVQIISPTSIATTLAMGWFNVNPGVIP